MVLHVQKLQLPEMHAYIWLAVIQHVAEHSQPARNMLGAGMPKDANAEENFDRSAEAPECLMLEMPNHVICNRNTETPCTE